MARNRKRAEFMTAQEIQAARDARIRKSKLEQEEDPSLLEGGPLLDVDWVDEARMDRSELGADGIYRVS